MTTRDGIPTVSQDPREHEFVQNPYIFYNKIRALGDFVYWRDFDMVMATTHVAAASLLKHPKLGREIPANARPARPDHMQAFYALEDHSLLEMEPPRHTRLRRVAMRGFDKASVAALAPDISRIADDLIGEFPDGPFDLLSAFAHPLPARVITRFLGLPQDMAGRLQGWSNDMVAMYQARRDGQIERAAEDAAKAISAYIGDVIDTSGTAPAIDFLSELVRAEAEGDIESREELISLVVLLLNAGHEASVHALGHAIRVLTGFAERRLALDPVNIAATVEECLRFAPPLHMFTRHVYDDVRIMGQSFSKGQTVGCLLGSACHDDGVWPDAEIFDPFRIRRPCLAFGAGLHVCVGASLARLEMQIALPALFSRCPEIEVVEPPEMADRYHFHGLKRLMVRVR